MDENQTREFYEKHKMKPGKEYRFEILKLSKEDIYDYMENHYADLIHEWRKSLFSKDAEVEKLKRDIINLQLQLATTMSLVKVEKLNGINCN